MKRLAVLLTLTVVVVAAAVGGYWWWKTRLPPLEDVLPPFSEVPSGPRAPTTAVMDVVVGKTTFAEVEEMTRGRDLPCSDTSARAIIATSRETKRKEVEAAKAAGQVDVVSGASVLWRRSPKENNPQVRWTCNQVPPRTLQDRERRIRYARWLLIFDSMNHPLRHVSLRRQHADDLSAITDFEETVTTYAALFGSPTELKGELTSGEDGVRHVPPFKSITRQWVYADLVVEVTLLNLGPGRGIDLLEQAEVPLPVRSDAPFAPVPPP